MKLGINFFFIIWVGALLQGCNQAPGFLEERGDSAIPVLDFESAIGDSAIPVLDFESAIFYRCFR